MRAALLTTAALAIALPIGLATPASYADSTTTTTAATQSTAIDANKLIGQSIYNAQEEKIGDVESVILNKDGKVRSVIVGVGGFLSNMIMFFIILTGALTLHQRGITDIQTSRTVSRSRAPPARRCASAWPACSCASGTSRSAVL